MVSDLRETGSAYEKSYSVTMNQSVVEAKWIAVHFRPADHKVLILPQMSSSLLSSQWSCGDQGSVVYFSDADTEAQKVK